MNDLVYRDDIYKAVKKELDDIADYVKIPHGIYGKVLRAIEGAPSTFWNPCDDENNVPPTGEEVLVTLVYPNSRKEVAFGEHWGENRNGDVAFWGGQNELVKAWAKTPSPYEVG